MRLAITIGRIDDKWQFIGQPGDAKSQVELFRTIRGADGKHGKDSFHEVRTFSADGVVSYKHTFDSDAQKQAHAKRVEADTKKFEAAKQKQAAQVEPQLPKSKSKKAVVETKEA